ncbi:hypothetical protein MUN77_09580 [Leucobacter allii]|uniref:hypothetical protein n=1 Tax=Leucobacter allii TaxID=2932247 RepID=UPI001FD25980|nr:hypothetical protein [Leucobacter allii]UOR00421.1 hypothetical protein MUN77_09580 [Leucobacter allii]
MGSTSSGPTRRTRTSESSGRASSARASGSQDRASSAPASSTKSGALRSWAAVLAVLLGVWAVFFGIPAGIRFLKAPPISEGFGIEDAVVALRLDARDTSYLVLVNEAGETRSVQLEERGFENSRIAWSEAGMSTGGPTKEYLIGASGLTELPLPATDGALFEHARLITDDGFLVRAGSTIGGDVLAFVDAERRSLESVSAGYGGAALASCDGEAVTVSEDGVRSLTRESPELTGLGVFDGVGTLACDGERVYGLDEISDGARSEERLRVWDRSATGAEEILIRYPDGLIDTFPGTAFVHDGRLYWSADWRLWSIPVPENRGAHRVVTAPEGSTAHREPVVAEAVPAAELGGFIDDYELVVGSDDGVLAASSGRVFGVAEEDEFVNPSKGPSYDKLLGLAIVSADVGTGEWRVEIDIDDIDFPKRDLHVHAIAVDPEWAAGR